MPGPPRLGLVSLRLVAVLFLAATLGCTTYSSRVREARQAFYSGDLATSEALLDKLDDRRPGERDVIKLDQAIVDLVQGRPQEAEEKLREVRDRFDYLEQESVTEAGVSMFTDDTYRAYDGEDYEKVLIRAFLAMSNLMDDGEDAVAYSLQVDQKQRELIERGLPGADPQQNPKRAYQPVAIGPYLHGVMREASHLNYDDAERSFATVASWEPNFQLVKHDLERVRSGVHSQRGHGVVYVIALVGRGPYKEETIAPVTSAALLIADRILSATGDHSLPPTIAPIKVPQIVLPHNVVQGVEVLVPNQSPVRTQTVTHIGRLAVHQYELTKDHILARAVARRVVKKATIYGAKSVLDVNSPWTELAFDAAGVVWEATETADTRSWGLLPESIQVARLELPAGMQTIALRPTGAGRAIGPSNYCQILVEDGRNSYMLAYFPNHQLVGQILTSGNPYQTAAR